MRFIKYILAAVIAVASPVQADTIGVHVGSYHFSGYKFNNFNPGVYWRGDSGFTLGGYRNSYKRNSLYAGWTFEDESKRFSLTLGAVTGYTKIVYHIDPRDNFADTKPKFSWIENKKVIRPLAAFSVKLTDNIRLSYVPEAKHSVSLLHLSFETKL